MKNKNACISCEPLDCQFKKELQEKTKLNLNMLETSPVRWKLNRRMLE
jgi:hypothetical protein